MSVLHMRKPKRKRVDALTAPTDARWYVDFVSGRSPEMPDARIVVDLRTGLTRTLDIRPPDAAIWEEVTDPDQRLHQAAHQFGQVLGDLHQWREGTRPAITASSLHPGKFRKALPEWAEFVPSFC